MTTLELWQRITRDPRLNDLDARIAAEWHRQNRGFADPERLAKRLRLQPATVALSLGRLADAGLIPATDVDAKDRITSDRNHD
jgi:predicted transcriptional regulator